VVANRRSKERNSGYSIAKSKTGGRYTGYLDTIASGSVRDRMDIAMIDLPSDIVQALAHDDSSLVRNALSNCHNEFNILIDFIVISTLFLNYS
jgi:hypothetical protein